MPTPLSLRGPVPMISTAARVQDNDDARSFNTYAAWSEPVLAHYLPAAAIAGCLPTVS